MRHDTTEEHITFSRGIFELRGIFLKLLKDDLIVDLLLIQELKYVTIFNPGPEIKILNFQSRTQKVQNFQLRITIFIAI